MNFIFNIFLNAICFVVIFFIGRFNLESAFMFALFVAIFTFKKMDALENIESKLQDSKDSSKTHENKIQDSNDSKNPNNSCENINIIESKLPQDSKNHNKTKDSIFINALYQCVIALFCASIINTNEWQKYVIVSILSLICIRIYDYFKPSVIGRFYNFKKLENSQLLSDKNSSQNKTTLLTNMAFYRILSAILNGVLSAITALIILKLLQNIGLDKYISTFLV